MFNWLNFNLIFSPVGRFNEVRLARRREDLDLLNNTLFSVANTTTTNTTANPSIAPSTVTSRVHSVVPSLVPSAVTSAHASYLASPQGKSRSTSNAPEYIPYTNTTISGNGNSSSVNDASAMVVKHGVLHFNQHLQENVSDVCDPDPWKVNHAISSSYSKAHTIPPTTTTTHNTIQSTPHSQKVSSEISAEASFRSVSSANSSDNYEDFSPVHSAMNKELLMQAYGTSLQQQCRSDPIDPSMNGINMTNSVSSQGPLFEMLQSPQVSPLSAKQPTVVAAEGPTDPFAVNVNISCNSHSRRRLDSRDQAQAAGTLIDPFAIQSGAVSKDGAVAVDDRMSDDILPSGHAVVQAHTIHMSSTAVHNNPFATARAVSVKPKTEIGPDQMVSFFIEF